MPATRSSTSGRQAEPHPSATADTPRTPIRPFQRGLIIGVLAAVILTGIIVVVNQRLSQPSAVELAREELAQRNAPRDAAAVSAFTDRTREAVAVLAPAVQGLAAALPGDEPAEAPMVAPGADDAEQWEQTLDEEAAAFADDPSSELTTRVARESFSSAIALLGESTRLYRLAAEAEPEVQEQLMVAAADQHQLAVRAWSVGATQLDYINVETGNGHQHVYLPLTGDGAFTPDQSPEGAGATTPQP